MSHNLYHSKNKDNEAIPQGSENTLIITQLSHLRMSLSRLTITCQKLDQGLSAT